jgi:tellurite resistance protein TehA-like permease
VPPEDPLIPAGSGAFVMGTGIVSVALAVDGAETLSRVLLALAAAGWVVAAAAACRRGLVSRSHPASLTAVAGTAVLGARAAMLGWNVLATVVLALAFALWLPLVPRIVRPPNRATAGTAFLVVVASEALAVLAAYVASSDDTRWLAVAGILPLALGLAAYPLVAARFDRRELVGGQGDQWVAGGALAIAAVACAALGGAVASTHASSELHTVLDRAALVVWVLAIAWLPVLVAGELRGPRRGYDLRRWATVFPVGMYAVCSFLVAGADRVGPIGTFARVWVWVSVAVWAVVFLAMARNGVRLAGHYDPRR